MRHLLREWLKDLLEWAHRYGIPDEKVADVILDALVEGGDATTTPPDAGT